MNKKRCVTLKQRKHTVRVTYEPDYDHEAWESDVRPTPESMPAAFYKVTKPAHPQATPPDARREPHRSLTTSMLRRRLYRAGVRGAEMKRALAEIMAGEPSGDGMTTPMSWSVSGLRRRFGRRMARAILRFVSMAFVVLDEFGSYASPALADLLQTSMRSSRKHSAAFVMVEQVMPAASATATRRVSFHR